ncbi:NAD(P)-binding protein [Corynespora cassiicola Philippines]|uniref:NAD(P)-binding protein n=1 Tax=Corynespora cassiicola Philippines TaxID=1448308 RepID=A0A2T2P6F8_CORCC|nr:NAD(P)-binding protein [Corynespora cassiicola Philippines]
MASKFQNQVVLVTGAASGIGRATTLKLASTGASLSLCDVNASALSGLEAEITDKSSVLFQKVDVSSESDVRSFVRATIEKFGRLDHIFNCAGINPTNIPFEETTLDYWDMQVGVNMKGVFLVTREGLPHMKRGSSIVTVASMSGTRGTAFQSIYRYASLPYMTKHGVIGMMKSLALEIGPRGIRVNCVAPGYINTPTNSSIVKGGIIVEENSKACALERWGTPEEVADVVIFLFSNEARYVSGAVYEVDGAVKW